MHLNYATIFLYHRIFFICTTFIMIALHPFLNYTGIAFALILFFCLGIPHGALDVSIGRFLFQPVLGSFWWILFLMCYLVCASLIVIVWLLYPLPSFLFFLFISALHFGFSDIQNTFNLKASVIKNFTYLIEGWIRGILPISTPAYFYPMTFQQLIKSSLSNEQTVLVFQIVHILFYPSLVFLLILIIHGFLQKEINGFYNSLELISIFLLFMILTPFKAFLIYFCLLHSIRHIVTILEEMHLPMNWSSCKWTLFQALPSTSFTLFFLWLCYWYLKQSTHDLTCMMHLFFISLAALTFPHMLLTQLTHSLRKSH